MSGGSCIVLTGRVVRYVVRGREYAKISIRNSKALLGIAGREVVVIVISNNEG